MKIVSLSVPKDRGLRTPNDDTVLVMPGVLAVFDGATAPQKARPIASTGRLASQGAAMAIAKLAVTQDLIAMPAQDVFAAISARIHAVSTRENLEGKPSTTMSMAVIGADEIRFLAVGDSGIRVNGAQIIRREKPIDDVSTDNRLAVHRVLSQRHADPDEVERLARFVVFEGFDEAVGTGALQKQEAATIRDDLIEQYRGLTDPDALCRFLAKGIRQQYHFANRTDHPMGFSTLNGDTTSMAEIIDRKLARSDVRTLEIFTDGYFLEPQHVSLEAWEDAFALTEKEDFHKLHRFANVKGSTTREFADDRSVIVAEGVDQAGVFEAGA